MSIIKKVITYTSRFWHKRSSSSYLNYLRKKGISIGTNCILRDVSTSRIDTTRPSLITIGNNVDMNSHFELLTHDWGGHVFIAKYCDFIPSHKRVIIGNNVYFGTRCVILSGAKIGDNCIIAACSLINKEIPSNSVAAGIPAKVICTIDEYYERRKKQYIEEVVDYARSIKERFNREPNIDDFTDDYSCFVDGSNIDSYPMMPYSHVFANSQLETWKMIHVAPYKGFDDFIKRTINKS